MSEQVDAELLKLGLSGPIEAGDVVHLNSGGPSMTVLSVADDGNVECLWFDKSRERKLEIPISALQKTTPEQTPVVILNTNFTSPAGDNES